MVAGIDQLLFADRLAVDGNTLPKIHHMRTRIDSHRRSACPDQRADHPADRGLPVGAGHMDRAIGQIGPLQLMQAASNRPQADRTVGRPAAEDAVDFNVS